MGKKRKREREIRVEPEPPAQSEHFLFRLLKLYEHLSKNGALIAIDFEGLKAQSFTELGFSIKHWSSIEELEIVSNDGQHHRTEHARRQSTVNKGKTHQGQMIEAVQEVQTRILRLVSLDMPIILLLHDHRGDSRLLRDVCGFPASFLKLWDMELVGKGEVRVVDTQQVASAFLRIGRQVSLRDCCVAMGVQTRNLHNARNDAECTLEVFIKMLEAVKAARAPAVKREAVMAPPTKRAKRLNVINLDDEPLVIDLCDEPLDTEAKKRVQCFRAALGRGEVIDLD